MADYINRGLDIGGGIGGFLGGLAAEPGADNARRRARGNLMAIRGLYGFRPEVQAGYEEALDLAPSAMEGIQTAPETRNAQLAALRSLMDMGLEGGMDAPSRAALLQAQAAAARERNAATGALRQSFAARGVGGGGMELALANAAGQQAANANAMAGVQAAGDARLRALQALSQGAGLAGTVRGQDFGEASARAGARDRVAEANTRNRQATQARNIDRQYGARQQTIDNRFRAADGQSGAYRDLAALDSEDAARRMQRGYAMGGALGSAAGGLAGGALGGWG